MQITFCGAAGTVTGSSYLVETKSGCFLVDCGMFQGGKELRELNHRDFIFNPGALDFVLLTHAHVDHSGLIPKLCKLGFKNAIYATKATVELCGIVLPDSGHIQEMEVEWRNRKHQRAGVPLEKPMYTAAEASACLHQFRAKQYSEEFEPLPGIRVRFQDAGHILGSAMIEVFITEDGSTTKVVFSGDLGQKNQPIIEDPSLISDADYLLIESTYGNRLHEDQDQKVDLLRKIITEAVQSGGNLVIPAFAVGRTQDLLYYIKGLLLNGQIPRIPVYIDSPMAVSVTEIYRNNPECYDEETCQLFAAHESPFEFPNLHFIRSAEESKQLNATAKGAIIISANGMCEAGRILHHLKHNLWRPESHILFVGYQAEETLGRRLLEGAKVVKIMGEEVNVQAKIHSIGGFSAHADQAGLLEWLDEFTKKPKGIFIVHGENGAQKEFATLIKERFHIDSLIPKWGERFVLNAEARLDQKMEKPPLRNFELEKTVNDMEHSIMQLHLQVKQSKMFQMTPQIDHLKTLIADLEEELKKSV
ncbi:MAG TPA: MBL fold hydrolase [Firmicutes bacterium]|jgi:metallo-beta-lactamase family protein|nr:MBL fold hydrolase [Bacillota bacterium]